MRGRTPIVLFVAIACAAAVLLTAMLVRTGGRDRIAKPELPDDAPAGFVRYIEGFTRRPVDPDSILSVESQRAANDVRESFALLPLWDAGEVDRLEATLEEWMRDKEGPVFGDSPEADRPNARSRRWVVYTCFGVIRERVDVDGPMTPAAQERLIALMERLAGHDAMIVRYEAIMTLMGSAELLQRSEVRRIVRRVRHTDPSASIVEGIDQRLYYMTKRGEWEGDL